MAGYIGSKIAVTQVDGYTRTEADAEFVNDPNAVITVSGSNVGIGTSLPSSVSGTSLVVHHTSAPRIRMTSDATGQAGTDGVELTVNGSDLVIENRESSANTRFYNGGAERMRIDSNGNVLIGCTSVPNSSTPGAGFAVSSLGRRILVLSSSSTGNGVNLLSLQNPNGEVGSIQTSGSSTSYNTSSDYRLKENVTPLDGAANRLAQIPVHRFNFISDPDTTVDGFLAHEVQAIVPEAITGEKDGLDADGNPVYQGIDQSKLVPLLTAALQEALQKIDALEARVAALEAV